MLEGPVAMSMAVRVPGSHLEAGAFTHASPVSGLCAGEKQDALMVD